MTYDGFANLAQVTRKCPRRAAVGHLPDARIDPSGDGGDTICLKQELEAKKALIWLTMQAASTTAVSCKGYFEAVAAVLPLAKWNPDGDKLDVPGGCPVVFRGPADFYEWADGFLGELLQAGAWLRQYVAADTPERKVEVVTQAQRNWAEVREIADTGRPEKGEQRTPLGKGNTADRAVAKIKRDRPDLYELVAAGEMSPHAAAAEHGGARTEQVDVVNLNKGGNSETYPLLSDACYGHE